MFSYFYLFIFFLCTLWQQMINTNIFWPEWSWPAEKRNIWGKKGVETVPVGRLCVTLWGTYRWLTSSSPPCPRTGGTKKRSRFVLFKSNIWRHGVLCSLPHLSVQTQEDEHDEETDGPQLRERHHGHSLRIGDESQARTWKPTAPPCHITICPTMNCEVIIGQWMRREDEDRINVIVKQNKEQRVAASGATAWKSQERSKGQRSLWT